MIREFQHENNQNELERRIMLEKVIMHNLQSDDPDNDFGSPSNFKSGFQVSEEKSKIVPVRSFLPLPNLSDKNIEVEQKKLRAEIQAHVSKNKTKALLMQLIGPTEPSFQKKSRSLNNSTSDLMKDKRRSYNPARSYLNLSGWKNTSSLNTTTYQ